MVFQQHVKVAFEESYVHAIAQVLALRFHIRHFEISYFLMNLGASMPW